MYFRFACFQLRCLFISICSLNCKYHHMTINLTPIFNLFLQTNKSSLYFMVSSIPHIAYFSLKYYPSKTPFHLPKIHTTHILSTRCTANSTNQSFFRELFQHLTLFPYKIHHAACEKGVLKTQASPLHVIQLACKSQLNFTQKYTSITQKTTNGAIHIHQYTYSPYPHPLLKSPINFLIKLNFILIN